MNISLHRRIALWYVLATTALVFVMTFVAQQVLVLNMRNNIDESLQQRAEVVVSAIKSNIAAQNEENYTDLEQVVEQLTEREFSSVPLFLRIGVPDGDIITEIGEIPDPIVPMLDRQIRLAKDDSGRFETIAIRGVESLRVYTSGIIDTSTGQTIAVIQTAETLSQIVSAQNQLWQFTLIVGIPGSLAALVIGLLILNRGFRPLDRILRHVHNIEDVNLQTGLPEEPRPPELQQLADSLNSMWERLASAFNARQMFVASVSHEVRTPLTAIEGQIDVLLMQPSLDAEVVDSLDRMSKEVRRLVKMTNGLLLNAQLDARPSIGAEDIRLKDLLEEAYSEVWVLARNVDFGLSDSEELIVPGDYDLVKQMVINLLDNAIKFTPRGGRIDLTLTREDTWAVIEVSDTGQGIPNYHIPNILRAFYKVDRRKGVDGHGAGLGLAIVKQIVDLHHGNIEIKSKENSGTVVRVRLLAYASPESPEPENVAAQTGARLG